MAIALNMIKYLERNDCIFYDCTGNKIEDKFYIKIDLVSKIVYFFSDKDCEKLLGNFDFSKESKLKSIPGLKSTDTNLVITKIYLAFKKNEFPAHIGHYS